MSTKVIWLRHAETELNGNGQFCGQTDCNITEHGREVTRQLRNDPIFQYKIEAVYVSPLVRTHQTAHEIFPNASYFIDDRIIEIDLGDWEGKVKTSANQDDRKAFLNGKFTPPGAKENHQQLKTE